GGGGGADAAGPAAAQGQGDIPRRPRVRPPVRPGRRPDAATTGPRDRDASGPDEPGHGDRAGGRRLGAVHDRRTGRERGERPDGRPVPALGGEVMSYLLKGVSVVGGPPTD